MVLATVLPTVLGGSLEVEELSQVPSGCLTSNYLLTGFMTSSKSFTFSQLPFSSVQGLTEVLLDACWGDLMRMYLTYYLSLGSAHIIFASFIIYYLNASYELFSTSLWYFLPLIWNRRGTLL